MIIMIMKINDNGTNWCFFLSQSQNFSLKKFLIFSQQKIFLIFWKVELPSPKIRKCLILSGLSPQNVSLKTALNFFLKRSALKHFLIFS